MGPKERVKERQKGARIEVEKEPERAGVPIPKWAPA